MKKLTIFILLLLLLSNTAFARMSDTDAYKKAQSLWGEAAIIAKVRINTTKSGTWEYRVGHSGFGLGFVIAGRGSSWEAAFSQVSTQ